MKFFPIALSLNDKNVLVVGAGEVSLRKTKSFLASGAKVEVIAPLACSGIVRLSKSKKIRWIRRNVKRSDVNARDLVVSAADNRITNNKVSMWAKKLGVLVNVVDAPLISDFISLAVIRKQKAIVAVYTDARDPVLPRDLKNFLKEKRDEFLSYRCRI
ncbi:MAG: NAD(P)-dependent oxidoreductase [Candidatus Omnitrophota bacterium]